MGGVFMGGRLDAAVVQREIGKEKRAARARFSSMLAEWTGLEPATPGVTGRYSNQLNYHSMMAFTALRPKPLHCASAIELGVP